MDIANWVAPAKCLASNFNGQLFAGASLRFNPVEFPGYVQAVRPTGTARGQHNSRRQSRVLHGAVISPELGPFTDRKGRKYS
jgi:hypothetical protein